MTVPDCRLHRRVGKGIGAPSIGWLGLGVLLLHTAPSRSQAGESRDLCFEVSYGPTDSAQYAVTHPVTKFPSTHALINNRICGRQFLEDDPIPATGMWSDTGASDPTDETCRQVSSGELFYGYNFPTAFQSNTGELADLIFSAFLLFLGWCPPARAHTPGHHPVCTAEHLLRRSCFGI